MVYCGTSAKILFVLTPSGSCQEGGGGYGWKPHRAQIDQFELFELLLILKLDNVLFMGRFEPTVSRSTVSSPPLIGGPGPGRRGAAGAAGAEAARRGKRGGAPGVGGLRRVGWGEPTTRCRPPTHLGDPRTAFEPPPHDH